MPEPSLTSARIVRVPPVVAVGSRFGKYRPEEEKAVRKVEVKEDEVLRQLKDAWKKVRYYENKTDEETYNNAMKQVRGIQYSAKDVENFSLALAEFQDKEWFSEKTGFFLSALINNGKDTDYVIHTQHLNREIAYLGYRNTKNITVNGDAGKWVGVSMKGGEVHLNGDYESIADEIKGGKIYHKGKLIVDK